MKRENPNNYEEKFVCSRINFRRRQSHAKEITGPPFPSQRDVRVTREIGNGVQENR